MSTAKTREHRSGRILRFAALVTLAVATNALADVEAWGASASLTDPALYFMVPESDLKSNASECWALQGNGADAGAAASSSGPGDKALDTGICLYHLLQPGQDRQGLLDAAGVLQNAQKWGMDRWRQALANLLEGLASCRVAALELNASLPPDKAQTPLFCSARKNALSSFSRLKLQELRVIYAEGTDHSIDELLSAMADCHKAETGPLSQKFVAGCGVYRELADADVTQVAQQAYSKIVANYFNGASAPITAMFARKKEMAQRGLSDAVASIDALESDSSRISSSRTMEKGLYDSIETPLTNLVQGYQETYATAAGVIKLYNAWNHGLFEDKSNGTNLGTSLQDRIDKVRALATSVEDATRTVNQAVAALDNRGVTDAAFRKNGQAMCRVFFCELAVKQGPPVSAASSYTRVCKRMDSPLCENQGTKLHASGEDFTMSTFCKDAGFPEKYTQYNLTRATASSCWTEAP